jgi:hypothetical protein
MGAVQRLHSDVFWVAGTDTNDQDSFYKPSYLTLAVA